MMKSTVSDIQPPFSKLRSPPGQNGAGTVINSDAAEKEYNAEETNGGRILCRQCGFVITHDSSRIAVSGTHHHTFANPHGIVFEIGCFGAAPGCAVMGRPTNEFTWFPPHSWQVAICGSCLSHMGWRFTRADGGLFFGLILDRLAITDM